MDTLAAPDPAGSGDRLAHQQLDAALAELEPDAVHILTLRYVHGYKLTEIAGLLGTSRGAVALRFFRVRQRLKKLLAVTQRREAMKDFEQRVRERMPSPEEERCQSRPRVEPGRAGRRHGFQTRCCAPFSRDYLPDISAHGPSFPGPSQRCSSLARRSVTAIVWPRGVRVYAAGNDGLQVTLADDSRVEMRAHAEMTVDRASDGIQIDLKTGDIIVTAAKQRDGRLYVRTRT